MRPLLSCTTKTLFGFLISFVATLFLFNSQTCLDHTRQRLKLEHEPSNKNLNKSSEETDSIIFTSTNNKSKLKKANKLTYTEVEHLTQENSLTHANLKSLPFFKARLDSRQIIRIYDWVWTGEEWEDLVSSYTVCLSTQASLDRIKWVPELVQNWNGPISLSVFIVSPEEWIGLNLVVEYFRKCYPIFAKYVSIHVALPIKVEKWSMNWENLQLDEKETTVFLTTYTNFSCDKPQLVVTEIANKFQANDEAKELLTLYPQNHMRNIAKRACGTEWVFSTDVDIIPRKDSAVHLQTFIWSESAQNCKKCAFVIPTFELDSNQKFPESKQQLVKYNNKKLSRPFHYYVFNVAHKATNYSRWKSTNLDEEPIKISHSANTQLFQFYEPFYVSPGNVPEFEERFIGYGFTRSSQLQEAVAEGWVFKVLTPIFGIHWGLQTQFTLINPKNESSVRFKQTFDNKQIFRRFQKELTLRKKLRIEAEKFSKKLNTKVIKEAKATKKLLEKSFPK